MTRGEGRAGQQAPRAPSASLNHPREWDAGTYHRVSAPQQAWDQRVLERLALRGDERVPDAGCGTGRVTAALREKLLAARAAAVASGTPAPQGRTPPGSTTLAGQVCALDRSVEMTRVARRNLPMDVAVVCADYRVFIERVVLSAWLARLADTPELAAAFLDTSCDAAASDDTSYHLDYVRVNIEATLPAEKA